MKTTTLPRIADAWDDQKVVFCNHEGYFVADVIVTYQAVTVIAKKPVSPQTLVRSNVDKAEWRIVDHLGGYWNPTRGRFVLPREAVTRLAP